MKILHLVECRNLTEPTTEPKLIFIIGPPRSGTTLTYQLMVDAFDIGYISNCIAPFYPTISIVERILRTREKAPNIQFKSSHGRTEERLGPNECGKYWYQFFPQEPHYVNKNAIADSKKRALRNSIIRIHKAFGKPLLFKNVINSARLQVLKEVFPNALFIEVERDHTSNARSIMRAKEKALGTNEGCWSLRPIGYESYIHLGPSQQAYQQISLTRSMIQKDRPKNYVQVRYEDLCQNPHKELNRILSEANQTGIILSRRKTHQIPQSFKIRNGSESNEQKN